LSRVDGSYNNGTEDFSNDGTTGRYDVVKLLPKLTVQPIKSTP
jgi:hypothetical protein